MARRHGGRMSKAEKDYHEHYEEYFGEPEYEIEDNDDEEESFGECYTWCGNPAYPKCIDSCPILDD